MRGTSSTCQESQMNRPTPVSAETNSAETTSTSYTYSGLACGTSYTLAVDAYDAAGNVSTRASLQSSTAPCSLITGPTIETLLYGTQGGAYGEGAWPGGNWAPYSSASPWNTQLPAYTSAVLEPTFPFGGRKVAWSAPAFANRHIFVRNGKELVCASLAAKP